MPDDNSETAKYRHLTVQYCQGNGIDIGSQGHPVVPWAIQLEQPPDKFKHYCGGLELPDTVHWKGDARDLPFKENVLDFIYCLKEGSLVRTKEGMVPIESVTPGAEVQSANGWRKVVASQRKHHSGSVVSIKTSRLPWRLEATDEHKIPVVRDGKTLFVNASEVRVGDSLISPFDSTEKDVQVLKIRDLLPDNPAKYDQVIAMGKSGMKLDAIAEASGLPRTTVWQYITGRRTPHDCFVESNGWITSSIKTNPVRSEVPVDDRLMKLVGYFVSDGCASNSKPHSVCFYFGIHETAFRDEVIHLMQELFGVNPIGGVLEARSNIYHIRYCSKILWHVFRHLGGVPRAQKIADWIMQLPVKKQQNLIGGLFAGDGCVSKDATSASYSSNLPALAMQVRELLLRSGIPCSLSISKLDSSIKGRTVSSTSYVLHLGGIHAERVGELSGKLRGLPKYRLNRSVNNYELTDSSIRLQVLSVDRVDYTGMVYDLQLEHGSEMDRTFTSGGLLVHNCSHVIEDFDQNTWPSMFREWKRCLKPGGNIIVLVPEVVRWNDAIRRGQTPNCSHWAPEPSVGDLTRRFQQAGLVVLEDRMTDLSPQDYTIIGRATKR